MSTKVIQLLRRSTFKLTGNSMIVRSFGFGGDSSYDDKFSKEGDAMLSTLDIDPKNISASLSKQKNKLNRGLDSTSTGKLKPLSTGSLGQLDNFQEAFCEVLNTALADKSFYKLFKGSHEDSSSVIEFKKVDLNRDMSHATAYWHCPVVYKFLKFVLKTKGEEEYKILSEQTSQHISKILKAAEPRFRALVVKELEFRRVPRIFFVNYHNEKGKDWNLKSTNNADLDDEDDLKSFTKLKPLQDSGDPEIEKHRVFLGVYHAREEEIRKAEHKQLIEDTLNALPPEERRTFVEGTGRRFLSSVKTTVARLRLQRKANAATANEKSDNDGDDDTDVQVESR